MDKATLPARLRRSHTWRRIPGTDYAIRRDGAVAHVKRRNILRIDTYSPSWPAVRLVVNGKSAKVGLCHALGATFFGEPEPGMMWALADPQLPPHVDNLIQVERGRGRRSRPLSARFKGGAV